MQVTQDGLTIDYQDLMLEIEPVFIDSFKREYGVSPSRTELKQYLVSVSLDTLLDLIEQWKSQIFEAYSAHVWTRVISTYIRKLY